MSDLATWLRDVLDGDERARAPKLSQWTPEAHESSCPGDEECICGRPAFVLADIAAKRAMVDLHDGHHVCRDEAGGLAREYGFDHYEPSGEPEPSDRWCPTLRLLASAYAGRPGYREEWRP